MEKVRKLEVDVVKLEKTITKLGSIHQTVLERNDAFYEIEKVKFAMDL